MSRLFSLWRRTAGGGWRTGDRLCPQLTPPPLPGPERPAHTEATISDISSMDGSGGFDQRVILVVPKTPRTSNTSGPRRRPTRPVRPGGVTTLTPPQEEVLLGRDVHDVDATSGACGWPGRPGLARGGSTTPGSWGSAGGGAGGAGTVSVDKAGDGGGDGARRRKWRENTDAGSGVRYTKG